MHAWDCSADCRVGWGSRWRVWDAPSTGCMRLTHTDPSGFKLVHPGATNCTISLLFLFFLSRLHWPMYLLNLAFPLMSRRGRHVPSCRLVTDPNDPTYPVKTGLLTGLAPPAMTPKSKLVSTIPEHPPVQPSTFDLAPSQRCHCSKAPNLHFRRRGWGLII